MEGSRNTWWERFEWWYLCHQPFSRICQSIRKLTFALMVIPSAWLSWVFTKLYSQRMNCKSFDLIDIWSMYVCIRLYEHQSSFQPKMPLFVDAESKGFIMLIISMLWHPCLWLRSDYGHSLATACGLTHLENTRAMELVQVSTTETPRRRDFPVETPEKAPRRIWSFGSYFVCWWKCPKRLFKKAKISQSRRLQRLMCLSLLKDPGRPQLRKWPAD